MAQLKSHSTLTELKDQFKGLPQTKFGPALTTAETIGPITHEIHPLTLPANADNVDVISTTGAVAGQVVRLLATGAGAGPVSIRSTSVSGNSTSGKNIKCGGATDSVITFDGAYDSATLLYDGTNWIAVSSFSGGPNQ